MKYKIYKVQFIPDMIGFSLIKKSNIDDFFSQHTRLLYY